VNASTLERIPLFAALTEPERDWVARWSEELDAPPGTRFLEQGGPPLEFFVIVEGDVEVRRDAEKVATLGPGDFFGEIAIVEQDRRNASVVATSPVHAIVMRSREFDAMREELPTVAARIEDAVRKRQA